MTQNIADQLAAEMADYCAATGLSLSSLSLFALGNSRFPGRLSRKMEQIETDAARMRKYIAAHPPGDRKRKLRQVQAGE